MRGMSNQALALLKGSHTAVVKVSVLRDGQVVRQLEGQVLGGSITSDGTAAQRTQFELDVAVDDLELVPDSMDDLLAPSGDRIQIDMGVRLEDTDTRVAVNDAAHGWAVTSTGIMASIKDDGTGALVLGP